MNVVQIPNGQLVQNCYLVVDEAARVGAIIDPGEDVELIVRHVAAARMTPLAIWITHAHVDHVLGTGRVRERLGTPFLPIALHPADRLLYDHVVEQALAFGMQADRLPPPDRDLVPGETLAVGSLRFQVRWTPGHSPGSVSLAGQGVVFTGDVLFQGSIGRTDLFGADADTLMRSIERELLTLPDDTIVYSGHGPETTIGRERRQNPFLTGAARPV
ncbi:MAG TPA: MBL fold metallo-hydrolase [Gemmatimonadales bacterium]|nr:MBL fold metallo-hydrolase [Gemmatimonadales bacterium]